MIITGLSYALSGNEVDMYLDNSRSSRLLLDSVAEFKLYQGKTLDNVDLEKIIQKDIELRLYQRAINFISIRPRSEYELGIYFLKQKILIQNPNSTSIIEEILSKLRKVDYVNDVKFCEWLIENRINCSLKSRAEVRNELLQKRIPSNVINDQLNILYSNEIETEVFEKVLRKKYGNITKIDKKQKLKVFIYFQRRGFSYDVIRTEINI